MSTSPWTSTKNTGKRVYYTITRLNRTENFTTNKESHYKVIVCAYNN